MVTETPEAEKATGTRRGRPRKGPANKPAAAKKPRKQRTPMSDAHKEKLAQGREQSRIVDTYLKALEVNKPRRGRKVTPESRQKRLDQIEKDLLTASGVGRLNLMQEQENLKAQLATKTPENDIEALEKAFVKVAAAYASNKGIRRSTFVAMGVPVPVLKAAGIKGTRGPGSTASDEDEDEG